MPQVIVCVREAGKTTLEFSDVYELPQIPSIGDYISVSRDHVRAPLGEDYIVRRVWWRLRHFGGAEDVGSLIEIFVECDISCGPLAAPRWEQKFDRAVKRGIALEPFDVARVPIVKDQDDGAGEH